MFGVVRKVKKASSNSSFTLKPVSKRTRMKKLGTDCQTRRAKLQNECIQLEQSLTTPVKSRMRSVIWENKSLVDESGEGRYLFM
jgi:hypothetical protein